MPQDSGLSTKNLTCVETRILSVPIEIIVLLVSLGTPAEILKWRQVSKDFKAIVDGSSLLQYLLLLDQLGYVEPVRPRQDLSFSDKIEFLRKYQYQLGNLGKSEYTQQCFCGDHGLPTNCKFSRGVVAHTTSNSQLPQTVYVYEITSPNKAVNRCNIWSLTDFGVPVTEFGMSISFDLLLLFEMRPTLAGLHTWPETGLKIHLRSLKSGTVHPAAERPYLVSHAIQGYAGFDFSFRIVGDFVMVLFVMGGSYESKLAVWDWPSGEQVAWLETDGDSFAFISPNILVIPRNNHDIDLEITNLGALDIFFLNPTSQTHGLSHEIKPVATLEFPNVPPGLIMTLVGVDSSTSPAAPSRTVSRTSTVVPGAVY